MRGQQGQRTLGAQLLEAITGPRGEAFLRTKRSHADTDMVTSQCRRKHEFGEALFSERSPDVTFLIRRVHWCVVEPGSPEHAYGD